MVSLPPTISALNFFLLHISEAALYTTFNTFSLLFTAYCAPLPPAGSIGSDYFPGFPTALFCCDFTPMISRLGADKSPSFHANLLFKPHQHVFFFSRLDIFLRKRLLLLAPDSCVTEQRSSSLFGVFCILAVSRALRQR